MQVGDNIEGWGTIHHMWQGRKEVKGEYTYMESKHEVTFISHSDQPRRHISGYEIAELKRPYPNGVTLIVEGYYGDNKDYIAVKEGKVIGDYHVDNYLRGRDTVGAGNCGELNGVNFYGSLSDWKKALKAL